MSSITLLVSGNPAASYLKNLDRLPESTRIIVSDDLQRLREAAPEADVLLNGDIRDSDLFLATFPHATRLRWAHSLSAGVEHILTPEIVASPVPLTNARGVFRRPLGEWVVAAMLHFAYQIPRMIRQKEQQLWEQFDVEELHGATLAIVGYGEIGRAAAERARPFGMRILALRRRPELAAGDPLVDAAYPLTELKKMLAESDYVAVAAPSTRETRGLIGAAEFAAMKRSAVIINVGRGPVIDERAMIAALEKGSLRGAALDVFEDEPLPAGSPLWKLPNVLISPHTADHTPGWRDSAVNFFVKNFEHFAKGEPLENIVDKHAGY